MLDVVRMALLAAVSLAIHIAERGCQWPVQPSKLYKKMQGFLIGGGKTSTVNYQESAQLAARRAEARYVIKPLHSGYITNCVLGLHGGKRQPMPGGRNSCSCWATSHLPSSARVISLNSTNVQRPRMRYRFRRSNWSTVSSDRFRTLRLPFSPTQNPSIEPAHPCSSTPRGSAWSSPRSSALRRRFGLYRLRPVLPPRRRSPWTCFSQPFTSLSPVWQQSLLSQPSFVSTHPLRGFSVFSGLPLRRPFSMLPFGTFNFVCLLRQLLMPPSLLSLVCTLISACTIVNLPAVQWLRTPRGPGLGVLLRPPDPILCYQRVPGLTMSWWR
ncbi:hypothetical protein BC629DRAFT_1530947 [Irpex lacteus]|nr:hypothetical protein BC629DRAFT_1530947 [Irpex lacteus]